MWQDPCTRRHGRSVGTSRQARSTIGKRRAEDASGGSRCCSSSTSCSSPVLFGLGWSAALVLLDLRRRDEAPAIGRGAAFVDGPVPRRWPRSAGGALGVKRGLRPLPSLWPEHRGRPQRTGRRAGQPALGHAAGPLYPGVHVVKPLHRGGRALRHPRSLWPTVVGKTAPEPLSVQSKEGWPSAWPWACATASTPSGSTTSTPTCRPTSRASWCRRWWPARSARWCRTTWSREVFATKREEVAAARGRHHHARRWPPTASWCKEVMLRDMVLPAGVRRRAWRGCCSSSSRTSGWSSSRDQAEGGAARPSWRRRRTRSAR